MEGITLQIRIDQLKCSIKENNAKWIIKVPAISLTHSKNLDHVISFATALNIIEVSTTAI